MIGFFSKAGRLMRRMKRSVFCSLMLPAFLSAGNAGAVDIPLEPDQQEMFDIAGNFGYAWLERNSWGAPVIRVHGHSVEYSIDLYNCRNGESCWDVRFSARWPDAVTPLQFINDWNREARYGKAFLDSDSHPNLTMDLEIVYGTDRRKLESIFDHWSSSLNDFTQEIVKK